MLESEKPRKKTTNKFLSDPESNGFTSTQLAIEIGFTSTQLAIEIGFLEHWTHNSQRSLMKAAPSVSKQSARKIMDKAATKVVGASQIIFNAKVETSWSLSHTLL